ncbi:hypothetical protein B0I35DRAFT_445302 [Stachybotrys elegans]|uniref:Fungal-type protein kinase domain-containing protein n=1 Tax=Stachybotrys elegans TaxID=80388 RepID=A0A8K0SCQ3_9HYPO|nr:hypothetical protein B0I35DRAFT_445302 [Stachybotrys elegans]
MDEVRLEIIEDNPIEGGLDVFRATFHTVCKDRNLTATPEGLESLNENDLQELTLDLLSALQSLRVSRLLPSSGRGNHLRTDLLRLAATISSNDYDLDRIKPLLHAVVTENTVDALVWKQVYAVVTESTPPPRTIASSVQQTPWLHSTAGFANSSEYRKDVDRVLKEELGAMYVGLPRFHETFFGAVPELDRASETVFKKCLEGDDPLFHEGWRDWPADANQDGVLSWLSTVIGELEDLANEHKPTTTVRRRPLAQPNKPIQGSTAERKLDVGFVNDPDAQKDSRCHWSQILVPGELKSNPSADTASKAWLDLGRYAREVLAVQDRRRFVLGFTLCGSLMRLWEFDRLGGIASQKFDINQDGEQFVCTILGFLWMNEECLGFDPTIVSSEGRRYIEIERNGQTERLIIDELMKRAPCVAGRATTCWKAHRDGDDTPLVIKDSWQYPERDEEGRLLQEATAKGVMNVARYHHHETVCIGGRDDDVQNNIRAGMNIRDAVNYRAENSMASSRTSTVVSARVGRSTSIASRKRSSSHTDTPLPPSKRSCSTSPVKQQTIAAPNRVHRRIVLRDFGKPIYKASSRVSLLSALEACIEGHESLRSKAGILQRDISINNLMINEDEENPSWRAFLIDLDLAIKEQREGASGAKGKTGTRAFMAIGVLLGEQHSFMHDLESFFWVLFWICIHYNGPNEGRVVPEFDQWNFISMGSLAELKKGRVSHEGDFIKAAEEDFTKYYQPLVPWVNRLRKAVFPNGGRWEKEDIGLYSRMKKILHEAQEDSGVLADV